MANTVSYWAQEILRHIPLVTSIGLTLALGFTIAWLTKRWRDCALLAMVCAAYGLTPFLPSWF